MARQQKKGSKTSGKDWTIQVLVPHEPDPREFDLPEDAVQDHSVVDRFFGGREILRASGAKLRQQWSETLTHVMELMSDVGKQAAEWEVEELEVGLTITAKGELAFIAEAGAEASVTVKLKRRAKT